MVASRNMSKEKSVRICMHFCEILRLEEKYNFRCFCLRSFLNAQITFAGNLNAL